MEDKSTTTPSTPPLSLTTLRVFGVLGILLALGAFGLAALSLALVWLGPNLPGGTVITPGAQMRSALLYTMVAVVLGFIGWGTLRARRWARGAALVLGWGWLLAGFLCVGFMSYLFSSATGVMGLPANLGLAEMAVLAFFAFLFVLVPAVGLVFYHLPAVKRVFELSDPESGWMDRCPSSVLLAAVGHVVLAGGMLVEFSSNGFKTAFFGVYLTGGAGGVWLSVNIVALMVCAWGSYRLLRKVWMFSLGWTCAMTCSAILSLRSADPKEVFPDLKSLDDLGAMGFHIPAITSANLAWTAAVVMGIWILYLLWIGRFFGRAPFKSMI